jgi:SAM-dependent methyltransferase
MIPALVESGRSLLDVRRRSTGAPSVAAGRGTRFAIPIPSGDVVVELRDGLASGRWRFRTAAATTMHVDFLASDICSVPGVEPLERVLPQAFIPTPRLRFAINGHIHDVVTTDPGVLERHYNRPRHQELAYHSPDPWTVGFHLARLRQARRVLRDVRGRVCDVGCGHSLVHAAGPWPFKLSACDRDEAPVAALRAHGVDAHVAPAEDPPFARGTFDAVYAGEIVEHLVDPHSALRRWVGLLRPGGRLIVTTPNRRHLLARVRGYELVENPEHLFEWDVAQLCRAVRGTGASVSAVEGLLVPIPVYVPRRGWRDLGLGIARRVPVTPGNVASYMALGRNLPRVAFNVAVVAQRR